MFFHLAFSPLFLMYNLNFASYRGGVFMIGFRELYLHWEGNMDAHCIPSKAFRIRIDINY